MNQDGLRRHVVIVGPMGSGKTTLGRLLADRLERPFFDSDVQIGEQTGRSGREIAATDGVDDLHRLERQVLLEALAESKPIVVAAAASVVDDGEVLAKLDEPFCVLVTADPAVLAERASHGDHRRQVNRLEHLERRDPLFRSVADIVIDTGSLLPASGVDRALAAMAAV